MSNYRQVINASNGQLLLKQARWCSSFACKLRGLTFRRRLAVGEGLILVMRQDNRATAGITMLFTFLNLGVVWVDDAGSVVDKVLARPWRLSYLPRAAARYAIEAAPDLLEQVALGDKIIFR